MVEVVWTGPAVAELDAIADHIAFEDKAAAHRLVRRIVSRVEQLTRFAKSGSRLPEWPGSTYRQLVIKPCRVFYRLEGKQIFIVFVMRNERLFRKAFLK
jgi:plasmid stabilization system protein ParE